MCICIYPYVRLVCTVRVLITPPSVVSPLNVTSLQQCTTVTTLPIRASTRSCLAYTLYLWVVGGRRYEGHLLIPAAPSLSGDLHRAPSPNLHRWPLSSIPSSLTGQPVWATVSVAPHAHEWPPMAAARKCDPSMLCVCDPRTVQAPQREKSPETERHRRREERLPHRPRPGPRRPYCKPASTGDIVPLPRRAPRAQDTVIALSPRASSTARLSASAPTFSSPPLHHDLLVPITVVDV